MSEEKSALKALKANKKEAFKTFEANTGLYTK